MNFTKNIDCNIIEIFNQIIRWLYYMSTFNSWFIEPLFVRLPNRKNNCWSTHSVAVVKLHIHHAFIILFYFVKFVLNTHFKIAIYQYQWINLISKKQENTLIILVAKIQYNI